MNMGAPPEKQKVVCPCLVHISHSLCLLFAAVRLGKFRKPGVVGGDVAIPSRVR